MRADEAVLLLAARTALMKIAKQPAAGKPTGGWSHRADGTMVRSIGGMDDLRAFLRGR